jgi:hypothetical protein
MPDSITPTPATDETPTGDTTCIHTRKIFDSCQSKDCIEDLRLCPTATSAELLSRAVSVKAGSAELLYVQVNVQSVGFHRGYFAIDLRYFYRITADAFCGGPRSIPICGLAVFDKRSILFGSESGAKVFSSETDHRCPEGRDLTRRDLPIAVVNAVDPVLLNIRLSDCAGPRPGENGPADIPTPVLEAFQEDLVFGGPDGRNVFVTLGQFSILRLERDAQLLMPSFDYCIPDKECDCTDCDENPCELFSQVEFPVDQFYPPAASTDIDPMRLFRTGN